MRGTNRVARHAVWIFGLLCSLQAHGVEPQWHAFDWLEAEVVPGAGAVKAGVVLPIKVNGVACYGQLDTGAPNSITWHLQGTPGQPLTEVDIEIAGHHRMVLASSAQMDSLGTCEGGLIATIGNAFFEDGTLTLDLKNGRFTFVLASSLEKEPLSSPFAFPRWSGNEGGHIVVRIGLPSGREADVLFDTGAASFGLSALTEDDWRGLTDGEPLRASPTVRTYWVNSWGREIPCYDTTLPGSIRVVQGLSVAGSRIAYCAQEAFKPGQKLVALLGLRDLIDCVITLDFLARRWMISR